MLVLENLQLTNNKLDDSIVQKEKHLKYTNILDEILKQRIMMKLKNNYSLLVDGRIIKFSEMLKLTSACANFDYKVNLENINKTEFSKIIDFLQIIEWNKSSYIEEIKAGELNNWYIKIQNQTEEILLVKLEF